MDRLTKTKMCDNCSLTGIYTQYLRKGKMTYRRICDPCHIVRMRAYQSLHKPSPRFQRPKLDKPLWCRSCGKAGKSYSTRDNGNGQRYYNLDCTTCKGRGRTRWIQRLRKTDPARAYRIGRHEQLMWKYKVSLKDYEAIFVSQGGVCAICGIDDRKDLTVLSMPLDHSHSSGKNRGILCHNCNHALGKFKDSPVTLRNAADYIEKWAAAHA